MLFELNQLWCRILNTFAFILALPVSMEDSSHLGQDSMHTVPKLASQAHVCPVSQQAAQPEPTWLHTAIIAATPTHRAS